MSEELMKPTLENPHYACSVCLSTDDPDYWEKHLTLARRARIGELVEGIVDGANAELFIRRLMDSYAAWVNDGEDEVPEERPTLLAALEALAKAIGGGDE